MIKQTDWIQTYTGRKFYPLEPDAADVNIEDIAHALAMKCRFNGHVKQFYSVAQHSVLMARHIKPTKTKVSTFYLKMWALLHDAGEAYLADIPRPVKPYTRIATGHYFNDTVPFGDVEEQLRNTIFEVVAPKLHNTKEPSIVKEFDLRILVNEAYSLMNLNAVNRSTWGALMGVERVTEIGLINGWTWQESKMAFMEYFTFLKGQLS